MSITSELKKLTSLKDRGDLSQAEFEKAKALLLPGENAAASMPNAGEKKRKTLLLVAILSIILVVVSAGAVVLAPSPIKLLALVLFTVACTLNWCAIVKQMRNSSSKGTLESLSS